MRSLALASLDPATAGLRLPSPALCTFLARHATLARPSSALLQVFGCGSAVVGAVDRRQAAMSANLVEYVPDAGCDRYNRCASEGDSSDQIPGCRSSRRSARGRRAEPVPPSNSSTVCHGQAIRAFRRKLIGRNRYDPILPQHQV